MPEPREHEHAGPTPSPDSREPQAAGREPAPAGELEAEQPQAGGSEADQPQDPCPICGAPLFGVHCKLICPNCGYREDCSDLFRL